MQQKSEIWIILGLVVLALVARMIPHPPNFSPLIAIALFAGHRWQWGWSFLVMTLILGITNLWLGADLVVWANAGIFFFLTIVARWLPAQLSLGMTTITAATSSLIFFVLSNFLVWALGNWYPATGEGLLHCFILAVPFFPLSVLSTLIYAVALWQVPVWSGKRVKARVLAT